MDRSDSESTLRDNLVALPVWVSLTALGLLAVGVAVGFTLLLAPNLSDALRSAGGQLLVVSLPVLALVIGVFGASRARPERIDAMVATYLRQTVGDKLEAYLVKPKLEDDRPYPYPPLFARMERHFRSEITSYCHYHLFDDQNRRFDIMVKSNVFNIEISVTLHLATPPQGYTIALSEHSYDFNSLEDWSGMSASPLVALVPVTIHGSLAEGYTVYVRSHAEEGGGLCLNYRLRQKLQGNFLTSPYLRRYFSEDAAIATYFLYSEAFANGKDNILGGSF
jgi:hypothetical protein